MLAVLHQQDTVAAAPGPTLEDTLGTDEHGAALCERGRSCAAGLSLARRLSLPRTFGICASGLSTEEGRLGGVLRLLPSCAGGAMWKADPLPDECGKSEVSLLKSKSGASERAADAER